MTHADLARVYEEHFGSEPKVAVNAPGRVNLIGEHTDYNDGFVLPAAIDRQISAVAGLAGDRRVRAYSVDFAQYDEFDLGEITHSSRTPWSNYLRGVAQQLLNRGYPIGGLNVVLSGNVPIGAGLSSSAALEVAVAELFRSLFSLEIDRVQLALLSQAAEREFVGVACGIMDQFASVLSETGSALFLDCRDLSFSRINLPAGLKIVVCNTRVQRSLHASEYNSRRSECESAVEKLKAHRSDIRALRDVTPLELEQNRKLLNEIEYRRARHVVGENQRVLAAVESLKSKELICLGRVLYHSHESLRTDFEVSCPELDLLVELARDAPGTIGSRMTGAGFGGCTVSLVDEDSVDSFCRQISGGYRERTGIEGEIYVCEPSSGMKATWL